MFVPDSPTAIKVYEQQNAIRKNHRLGHYFISEEKYQELKSCEVFPGDIIVSCAGTIGEAYVLPQDMRKGILNQALMRVALYDHDLTPFYLILFEHIIKRESSAQSKGTAMTNIPPLPEFKQYLMPIPPLAEQRRIVEALDKYLALVDEIEQAQADLDALFAQLKSKVLDLAIRGELTAQDPDDEPADKLLERIQAEKVAMVERGELKPKDIKGDTVIFTGSDGLRYEKPADGSGEALCIEDEIPFDVPGEWAWSRLSGLVSTYGGKTPSKSNRTYWDGGGVPWITSKDMKEPELYGSQIELTHKGAEDMNIIAENSVLMVVRSGILRRLLPVAINRVKTTINQDLKAMTPFDASLAEWLFICFSAWDKRVRDNYHKDGTTVDSIEFDTLLSLLIPIPPAKEQKRILQSIRTISQITS